MRSPQITGLECPRPGMAVFQRMFFPDSTFHSAGGEPVPTPLPEGPRNCGQLPSAAAAAIASSANILVFIRFQCTAQPGMGARLEAEHCRGPAHRALFQPGAKALGSLLPEIGRASCREREEI